MFTSVFKKNNDDILVYIDLNCKFYLQNRAGILNDNKDIAQPGKTYVKVVIQGGLWIIFV
jgi:hypothetical protein